MDENDKRPVPIGKNKKITRFLKDKFGGKIMTLFVGVRAKIWAYLMDDGSEHKKGKGTKKCVMKRRLMVKNYEDCLLNNKIILKSQQRFKSDHHEVYIEEVNDDKRLQTFDRVTAYPNGTNIFKVYESEMLKVCEAKATLNMLIKECKSEMYVKKKREMRNVFKICESEMRKSVEVKM